MAAVGGPERWPPLTGTRKVSKGDRGREKSEENASTSTAVELLDNPLISLKNPCKHADSVPAFDGGTRVESAPNRTAADRHPDRRARRETSDKRARVLGIDTIHFVLALFAFLLDACGRQCPF